MLVLLTSIGSRGDMEPLLALGEQLHQAGHQIHCLFPEQFGGLAREIDFGFSSLGPEFIQMLESPIGQAALGGSGKGLKKFWAYIRLAITYRDMNKVLLKRQKEEIDALAPDLIIHNAKVMYAVLWSINTGRKALLNSPVPYLNYVEGHAHLAFNANYGPFLNKLSFRLTRFAIMQTLMTSAKWAGMKGQFNKTQVKDYLDKQPTAYTISSSLFPRPLSWPKNLQVVGYYQRNQQRTWQPDEQLLAFLDRHPKVLFLTFGSMTNPKPEQISRHFLKLLEKHRIPTLVNTSYGGLLEPENYDTRLFHFVKDIPYDWIMQRVYAVVHHGGSGTTHMVCRYGCASLIIPHIIDQFVWNKMLHQKGIGPLGPSIGKIRSRKLELALIDLWNNQAYKLKAKELQASMQSESDPNELVRYLEAFQKNGTAEYRLS